MNRSALRNVLAVVPVMAALGMVGCGGGDRPDRAKPVEWVAPAKRQPMRSRHRPFSRSSRRLAILVESGHCVDRGKPQLAERRFLGARIEETPKAVTVTALELPEKHRSKICAGIGESFIRTIRLPQPVGRRAVIDGSTSDLGDSPIRYPALDPSVQQGLERTFVGTAAERECRDEPIDILQVQYGTVSRDSQRIARAVSASVSRSTRTTAYKRCLTGLGAR